MRSRRVVAMAALVAAPASGDSGLQGRWHRDNYGTNHEVLICNGSTSMVTCRFMAVPEPAPGPPVESQLDGPASASAKGRFVGEIVASCPVYDSRWNSFCDEAVVIAQGDMTLRVPGTDEPYVFQETIAVHSDGSMMLSWDAPNPQGVPFYCPWYRSYQKALDEPNQCYDGSGAEFPD